MIGASFVEPDRSPRGRIGSRVVSVSAAKLPDAAPRCAGIDAFAPYLRSMTDTRSPEQRRRIMQSVGQKNTGPEIAVRKIAHALGYRFRLHRKDLPGRPDLVFPGRKKVVFVHGCFWHGHGCPKGRLPKSRPEFWVPKIEGNRERDHRAEVKLAELGWESLTLWQCEAKNVEAITAKLVEFLGPSGTAEASTGGSVGPSVSVDEQTHRH